jgi:NADH-quinone oxidoreductase subunit N
MVLYMIDVTGFFAVLLALSRGGRPITKMADLAGLKREKPGMAIALTVLSLSVLGMPPFSGFWAKYYVFKAAIAAGLWQVALLGLIASVVAAFYYLRMIKIMWFDPAPGEIDRSPSEARWVALAVSAFTGVGVWFALGFLDQASMLAASAFGLH